MSVSVLFLRQTYLCPSARLIAFCSKFWKAIYIMKEMYSAGRFCVKNCLNFHAKWHLPVSAYQQILASPDIVRYCNLFWLKKSWVCRDGPTLIANIYLYFTNNGSNSTKTNTMQWTTKKANKTQNNLTMVGLFTFR